MIETAEDFLLLLSLFNLDGSLLVLATYARKNALVREDVRERLRDLTFVLKPDAYDAR